MLVKNQQTMLVSALIHWMDRVTDF